MATIRLSLEGQGSVFVGNASISVTAQTTLTSSDYSITESNAAVGDVVCVSLDNAGAQAGLVIAGAWVSAAGTIKVRVYNSSGSTLTAQATTVRYTLNRS